MLNSMKMALEILSQYQICEINKSTRITSTRLFKLLLLIGHFLSSYSILFVHNATIHYYNANEGIQRMRNCQITLIRRDSLSMTFFMLPICEYSFYYYGPISHHKRMDIKQLM